MKLLSDRKHLLTVHIWRIAIEEEGGGDDWKYKLGQLMWRLCFREEGEEVLVEIWRHGILRT